MEMDHGGPCIPVNRFRGTTFNPPRLTALKKISPSPSTEMVEFDPSSRFVTPGSSGGTFSARGQLVTVTLPSLHNEYYIPTRASRRQPILSNRFVPTESEWTPGVKLSTRERLKVEQELLEEAKQRNRMTQVIPHRSQQPYLMAGFPITLQKRSPTPQGILRTKHLSNALLPPQSSLVNDPEEAGVMVANNMLSKTEQSVISLPGQSCTSDLFLTQTTLDPIIGMDEITVRKSQFNNFRSPCSLLGKDKVSLLSGEFRKIALTSESLAYSHAEQLVESTTDPSHAVQVLDLNKDGFVDIKEYVVVMALSQHYYKSHTLDQEKVEKKLKSLRSKFEELDNPTLPAILHGFSRLLISDGLMGEILSSMNCDPVAHLTYLEYICVFMFWEELEDIILEEDLSGDIEISSYISAYLGACDSTFSFEEALSSTFLTE